MRQSSKQSASNPEEDIILKTAIVANRYGRQPFFPPTFIGFMQQAIQQFALDGKVRTKETYISAMNSFLEFNRGEDLSLKSITAELMASYESYLHNIRGISRNSSSFYMRILRALYNRAVANGMVKDSSPFKYVYTGVDKTKKRALSLKAMKKIVSLDLAGRPRMEFARDLFMFSFYTRGMSFVDMSYLKKSDLKNGMLSYRRLKTGQQLYIKWEKCMQSFIDKWGTGTGNYLLPIITEAGKNERVQYQSALSVTNALLKRIGEECSLSVPLTTYVARHSWASIAKCKNVPLSIISEGMGHDSEKTTQIYLASLETSVVDKANSLVLKALLG